MQWFYALGDVRTKNYDLQMQRYVPCEGLFLVLVMVY